MIIVWGAVQTWDWNMTSAMRGVTISIPGLMTKSEFKQTVRQHEYDKQQLHLGSWTAVNRHSSKNRADLATESRILFFGCMLEQGWRTLLHSVVKRWLDPECTCGEGRAGPFIDLRMWFTSCVVLSATQLPSITLCEWVHGHLAPFRKSLNVAESGSFQKV